MQYIGFIINNLALNISFFQTYIGCLFPVPALKKISKMKLLSFLFIVIILASCQNNEIGFAKDVNPTTYTTNNE